MAANPKTLRVVDAYDSPQGGSARILVVTCIDGASFDKVGGKYIILHTGLNLGDKAIKRAYSLMPRPGEPLYAEIAIKRLGGPGSQAMHAAPVGSTFGFSGPWGKLLPEPGLEVRSLLVATDTGITSALGIVAQSVVDDTRRPTEVLWLRSETESFLDQNAVRATVVGAGVRCVMATIPDVDAQERASVAWEIIEARISEVLPTWVIATGDGAIVHPLRTRLTEPPFNIANVRIECFFRNPEKKIG